MAHSTSLPLIRGFTPGYKDLARLGLHYYLKFSGYGKLSGPCGPSNGVESPYVNADPKTQQDPYEEADVISSI